MKAYIHRKDSMIDAIQDEWKTDSPLFEIQYWAGYFHDHDNPYAIAEKVVESLKMDIKEVTLPDEEEIMKEAVKQEYWEVENEGGFYQDVYDEPVGFVEGAKWLLSKLK